MHPNRSFESLTTPQPEAIQPNQAIVLPLNGPSLEKVTDIHKQEHDVIARVNIPEWGYGGDGGKRTTVLVSRQQEGKHGLSLTYLLESEDGTRTPVKIDDLKMRGMQSGSSPLQYDQLPGFSMSSYVLPTGGKKKAPTEAILTFDIQRTSDPNKVIDFAPVHGKAHDITIEAASKVDILSKDKATEYTNRTWDQAEKSRRRQTRQRIGKWVGGAVLAWGLVQGMAENGGAIDKAMDMSNNAEAYVKQSFPEKDADSQAAVDRVAETMGALDRHDNKYINEQAQKFEAEHANELMPKNELASFKQSVEQATSTDDMLKSFDQFINFYGPRGGAYDGSLNLNEVSALGPVDANALRQSILGVMDAYGIMPKSFINSEGTDIRGVLFGKMSDDGIMEGFDNGMQYIFLRPGGDRKRVAEVSLHELAHAQDRSLVNEGTGGYLDNTRSAKHSVREWLNLPIYDSEYAEKYGGAKITDIDAIGDLSNEEFAEVEATVLEPNDQNTMAHPDNTRRFTSEANHKNLAMLASLEKKLPGFTAYIASQNGLTNSGKYNSWMTLGINDN